MLIHDKILAFQFKNKNYVYMRNPVDYVINCENLCC